MNEIKNAQITETFLGVEDHGILTFSFRLDFGGVSQTVGFYSLDEYNKKLKRRVGIIACADLLLKIFSVFKINSWEDIKYTNIRVQLRGNSVIAIGNLMEEKWLNFEKFFKKYREE